jgi:hypothetical protein
MAATAPSAPPTEAARQLSRMPPADLVLPQLRRGALLWFLSRATLWAMLRFPPTTTLTDAPWSVAIIISATAALAAVDARIMHEGLFHASLGVPRWAPLAGAALAAVALEIALAVIL